MFSFDPLESRLLHSITLAAGGVLKIVGTKNIDTITVSFVDVPSANVREVVAIVSTAGSGRPGERKTFPLGKVKKLDIRPGAANDSVNITGAKKVPVYAALGAGLDRFTYSDAGKCTVLGGDGSDNITTGSGADSIDGGAGDDLIVSGGGNDTITGGTGIDNIDAGAGNDTIFARDAARDVVKGNAGADRARVGPADDILDSVETVF